MIKLIAACALISTLAACSGMRGNTMGNASPSGGSAIDTASTTMGASGSGTPSTIDTRFRSNVSYGGGPRGNSGE